LILITQSFFGRRNWTLEIKRGRLKMMGMGFRQEPSCRQAIQCQVCRSYDGHTPDCPQVILESLLDRQVRISCPVCHSNAVDVNAHDFYECRNCHTQFSRGAYSQHSKSEIVWLDDPNKEDLVTFVVLLDKGDGQFPIDQRIETMRKEIKTRRRKR